MFEVVYFSRTGNTRKVAEAIAGELGTTARDIKTTGILPEEAFIFLGTGCYGATLPAEISRFLERNRFSGRRIALFTTSGFGALAEQSLIEKQITDKGAVITHTFKCFGRFLAVRTKHPTQEEMARARQFARNVAITLFPQSTERIKVASLSR